MSAQNRVSPAGESSGDLCQIETAPQAGRIRRPGLVYGPLRIAQIISSGQLKGALVRKLHGILPGAVRLTGTGAEPTDCEAATQYPVLDLNVGEWVQVKSYPEILKTLDEKGRYKGLTFTPEMVPHCGKRYRVLKRLELMFDEYHRSQRRMKNTVLLEGVVCQGAGLGCDRSCFLYWREMWLCRIDSVANAAPRA